MREEVNLYILSNILYILTYYWINLWARCSCCEIRFTAQFDAFTMGHMPLP